MSQNIPKKQRAVQLTGPNQLVLNSDKEVYEPGPTQMLCKVEAVGICFSDMKLLAQFDAHPRKSEILSHLSKEVLSEIPSYVPNQKPTIPGHEVVVRIVKTGSQVRTCKIGRRYLVQTDYRDLKTAGSNAAFGYNFEGAMQEYVLIDERVSVAQNGESYMFEVPEAKSASAIALVEPWSCVEGAYIEKQRTSFKKGGTLLLVKEGSFEPDFAGLDFSIPGQVLTLGITVAGGQSILNLSEIIDKKFDDIIYCGNQKETVEKLFPLMAKGGLINIVTGGQKFGQLVSAPIGDIHYLGKRLTGTVGSSPIKGYENIPISAEVRPGDSVKVMGAGGPMGVMHVYRDIALGLPQTRIIATDLDDFRLQVLANKVSNLARQKRVIFETINAKSPQAEQPANYIVIMAPLPVLVKAAIDSALPKAIINVFAGIPAGKTGEVNLDHYIEKELYLVGTSGSTINDMKKVLHKVVNDELDTNISVAAIGGLEGAIEGIGAVRDAKIPGKIVLYPALKNTGIINLPDLGLKHPRIGARLKNGQWTKAGEDQLLGLKKEKNIIIKKRVKIKKSRKKQVNKKSFTKKQRKRP